MKKRNSVLDVRAIQDRQLQAIKESTNQVLMHFHSSMEGLKPEQVLINKEKYGQNRLTTQNQDSRLKRLMHAFINPFTIILMVLALVSLMSDVILPIMQGDQEAVNAVTVIIIVTMIGVSGLLRYREESKSKKATEALLELVTTTTNVHRAHAPNKELPLDEVVVGDIIQLAAGDMMPADLRIIQAKDLFIGQASLTGESIPVEKEDKAYPNYDGSVLEAKNLVFMGCNVISGSALGIVIATGDDTYLGAMASSISQTKTESSFDLGVRLVSMVLIRFMLVMVPIVFVLNGLTKGDFGQSFLFAISIAVGLTPEMLPMIVTSSLAKGAVSMSKQKTIIKNLNAIQDFGAMDILCTDKTGTLTQDKVVLEYHLNVMGQTDDRVLRHAFLNSYYQTGLKNLLDEAIISCSYQQIEDIQQLGYQKVDEIPFDFNRRRMSVVVEDKDQKRQMITKGAIEEIVSICDYVDYGGQVLRLTDERKLSLFADVETYNQKGMRVLGVAQKTNPRQVDTFSVEDESEMVLIGYLAFLDPPKETTAKAIETLKNYGVSTKILTGDNDKITTYICEQVGMEVTGVILGESIDLMTKEVLAKAVEQANVFAKLSPLQKQYIINILKENGHVVGYMGDGINDAPAMKAADIGISVDTAVDIAKESADVILLEKDLMVLESGLIEGRKTYANIIKYIKMTASSNFGNMFSVLIASAFLPFLPMLSIQLIVLNLIYDMSCSAIPWDHVDEDFIKQPRTWDATSIGRFMRYMGPTSSVFDVITFIIMYMLICPMVVSNGLMFHQIPVHDVTTKAMYIALFQSGWFVASMWTQTMVIHMIRTPKLPFIQSRASWQLSLFTLSATLLVTWLPFSPVASALGLAPLPLVYFIWLFGIVIGYMLLVNVVKVIYIKRFKSFL